VILLPLDVKVSLIDPSFRHEHLYLSHQAKASGNSDRSSRHDDCGPRPTVGGESGHEQS
jgi:hypothetical protein